MSLHLPSRSLVCALAPLLLLSACGKSSAPQAGATASGEILPGSVSDAMLETDRSQAQAPLAPTAHSAAAKADASTAADASGAATDANAEIDPANADTAPTAPKTAASAKPANP